MILLLVGLTLMQLVFLAAPSDSTRTVPYAAGFLLLVGFFSAVVGFAPKEEKEAPREEEEDMAVVEPAKPAPQVAQPVTREVYKEREIIREIVKIRCRNCGTLFEEKLNRCPHCGAPS